MLFVRIYLYDFCRIFGCLSAAAAQTSGWPSFFDTNLVQTLIDSVVVFFIKCLLSVMNVFISGPELTSSKILLSVWDWGGGRTPILFVFLFWRFQAENQNAIQNRAISHYMWRFTGVPFPNTMMVYGILISSFSVQSVSLFYVSLSMGVFVPMYLSFHWMCTRGVEL